MKTQNCQGWLVWSKRHTTIKSLTGCLMLVPVLLSGCSGFNDYMPAPTIVDASQRPPYITAPTEIPQTKQQTLYPLDQQIIKAPEPPIQKVEEVTITPDDSVTKTTFPRARELAQQPIQQTNRRVLYEYAPEHPAANEHGYIRIVNPNYTDNPTAQLETQRSKPLVVNTRPAVSPAAIPIPAAKIETTHLPVGQPPVITQVSVTGTDEPESRPFVLQEQENVLQESKSTELPNLAPLPTPSFLDQTFDMTVTDKGAATEAATLPEVIDPVTMPAAKDAGSSPALPEPLLIRSEPEPAFSRQQQRRQKIDSVKATVEDLFQRIKENPDDTERQLSLRFLYLAYDQKDKALELIPDVPAQKQAEAITIVRAAMLTAQTGSDDTATSQTDTANRALEALHNLQTSVAEQADLAVAHLEICRDQSVKGFGQYEPIPPSLLAGGESRTVQIYCELKNFKSRLNAEGKYVTNIAAAIELVDEDYRSIYQLPKSEIPDVPSFHPRHDFFFRGQIKLPQLAPGKYELVVKVEDKFAGKLARPYRRAFEVKAAQRGDSFK